jgi:transcriptional regulator with XRE-family HTH domain
MVRAKRDEIRRQELSNFLRTRRARLRPDEAGLPAGSRRRTPGLRREEVAQLAGMSTTWYTWLEQKRAIKVSAGVLENLARVLRLDPIERVQLFQLARQQPDLQIHAQRETVSPILRRTIERMENVAAAVMGARWDVLAWNTAARAFFFDFESVAPRERNLVWLTFTNPVLRLRLVDWPSRAQDILARFRGDYGHHAGEPHFVELVERVQAASPEFAVWWPRHDVRPQSEGRKRYKHGTEGEVVAEHLTLSMSDNPQIRLLLFTPVAERDSIARFKRIIRNFEARPNEVIAIAH